MRKNKIKKHVREIKTREEELLHKPETEDSIDNGLETISFIKLK